MSKNKTAGKCQSMKASYGRAISGRVTKPFDNWPARKRERAPVKQLHEMSSAEIAALEQRYGAKVKLAT